MFSTLSNGILDPIHKEFMHWAFYFAIEKDLCDAVELLHKFSKMAFFDMLVNKPILESLIKNNQFKMIMTLLNN